LLTLVTRLAVPADATAIAEVHVAAWRTTYRGIVDQGYIDTLSVAERAAAWSQRLSGNVTPAPDILVAVGTDGRIVGFISGGLIREPFAGFDAELHAIYLLEAFQRAVMGRRLVREWATLAVAHGLRAAVVRVLAANPARLFYERLGAEYLREAPHVISGKPYPESWYGWRSLRDLTV
jgi:ribosomal protein S18 acetylase RimI-like enzyme